METIDDILCNMREFADEQEKNNYYDLRALSTDSFRAYSDLIESAVKSLEADRDNWRRQALDEDERANLIQSVTNCNQLKDVPTTEKSSQVGNAAALREALDEIRVAAMSDYEPDADYLIEKCNAALAKPPRNCDRLLDSVTAIKSYQEKTGLNKHQVPLWTAAQIYALIDWLFAEAKGVNK